MLKLVVALALLLPHFHGLSHTSLSPASLVMALSNRIENTENAYIEDVLDHYSALNIHNLTYLAMGSTHWSPPQSALDRIHSDMTLSHRYGAVLGYEPLRSHIKQRLHSHGLNMDQLDVAITAGANQAFVNAALAICDSNDTACIIAPYYFSHKLSLQLANVNVKICPFDPTNLLPKWDVLEQLVVESKMVVLTTPNNPSGVVWSFDDIKRLVELCKKHNTWLVADQTYYEFLHDDAVHTFPCNAKFDYNRIIHIFSCSKCFGMPGWRVGYMAYPRDILTNSMRKLQDTIPTHAPIISQKLALHCFNIDDEESSINKISWVKNKIKDLTMVRDALIPAINILKTVYTTGAFYFLVPTPPCVTDEEAVDILAKEYKVLLMPGTAFGAPNYLRLSYGSIPMSDVLTAVGNITAGFQHLLKLSDERNI